MRQIFHCLVIASILYPSFALGDDTQFSSSDFFRSELNVSRVSENDTGYLVYRRQVIATEDVLYRPMLQVATENLAFDLHLLFTGAVKPKRREGDPSLLYFGPVIAALEPQDSRYDLALNLSESDNLFSTVDVDRASVKYSFEDLTLELGRRPHAWGNAMMFPVLDVFTPFRPLAINTEYRSGLDMALVSWAAAEGLNFEAGHIFREPVFGEPAFRDSAAGQQDNDSSIFRLQRMFYDSALELQAMFARHYGGEMFAGAVIFPFADGVLRSELSSLEVSSVELSSLAVNRDRELSFLVNFDTSWDSFSYPTYAFIEYYHSGFGVKNAADLFTDATIRERFSRGETFTIARNGIGIGSKVDFTERTSAGLSAITNLGDLSGTAQGTVFYDLWQDVELTTGVSVPWGDRNTEFGGLPVAQDLYLAPGMAFFLKLSVYGFFL